MRCNGLFWGENNQKRPETEETTNAIEFFEETNQKSWLCCPFIMFIIMAPFTKKNIIKATSWPETRFTIESFSILLPFDYPAAAAPTFWEHTGPFFWKSLITTLNIDAMMPLVTMISSIDSQWGSAKTRLEGNHLKGKIMRTRDSTRRKSLKRQITLL